MNNQRLLINAFCVLCIFLSGCASAPAKAPDSVTVDQFLNVFQSQSESSCVELNSLTKDYESQGKTKEVDSIAAARENFCECIPEQIKTIRSSGNKEDLKKVYSEHEILLKYKPILVDRCAARVAMYPYKSGCEQRFKNVKKDSAKYCACMGSYVGNLKEDEATKIGTEAAEYIPKLAEAKKEGLPAPERPQSLKKFMETETSCSSK